MAILKNNQLKQKTPEEISKLLYDLNFELLKERGKIQIGSPPENPGRVSQIRKTIARIKNLYKYEQPKYRRELKKRNKKRWVKFAANVAYQKKLCICNTLFKEQQNLKVSVEKKDSGSLQR